MFDQILKIEISASSVAWYGAIVATASVLIALLNYFRDRHRVKITYQKDVKLMGTQGIYDQSKTYFNITVINKGRRPVKIEKAAIKIVGEKGYYLLGDSFAPHRMQVLTEDSPKTEFLADQSLIDLSKIWYIYVYDATGRKYKKYTHILPTFWRIWCFLKFRK